MRKPKPLPLFRVGDRVRVPFGRGRVRAVVVEDRGPLGINGRRLFQVSIPMDPFEPMRTELPEVELELAEDEPAPLTQQEVADYLINGGLIVLLSTATDGHSSRVWLCRDALDNVTHTFDSERGLLGGQVPPIWAVHNQKVFKPKQVEVSAYLESFGLSKKEADQILAKVGVSPR